MTGAELNEALRGVELTHPVGLDDVEALRTLLDNPPGLSIFHRIREVVVRIYRTDAIVCERTLTVSGI